MPDIEERIRLLEEHVDSYRDDLRVLRTLVEHDHSSALNKIRYITEKVLHQLCTDHDVSWGKTHPTLERMLGPLVANDVIPRNIAIHVRTIQTNASPGSHYQESALTSTHVHIAQVALVDFLEWQANQRPSLVGVIPDRHAKPVRAVRRRSGLWIAAAIGSGAVLVAVAVLLAVQGDGDPAAPVPESAMGPETAATDAGVPVDAAHEPAADSGTRGAAPTGGFRIGGDVTLAEAAMLWRRLQRERRHEGVTFLSTVEGRYAVMAARGATPEQAAEVAAAVGLEASPSEAAGGAHLVPRHAQTTTSLNLRSGPGREHPTVRILPNHTIVVVIEGTVEGLVSAPGDEGFLYVVATDNHSGWCAATFLAPEDGCLPRPDPFLAEAPAARAEALARDLTYTRVRLLAPAGSGLGFVLLARDMEIGRSHVGVFLERGACNLERQFFSTIDGIVEGIFVVETERYGGETLLLTESHPSLEPGPDGREIWHAYRLTSTHPVWTLHVPTYREVPRRRRSVLTMGVTRAGSVSGYWPVRVHHRSRGRTDYYRWNGTTLELDTAVSQPAADAP